MAEFSVLHQEPRHSVENFVNELLVRAQQVIADMGPALERLLQDMVAQFRTFQEQHYLITLDDVRFAWIRWTKDGQLVIEFALGMAPPSDEGLRHVVIDAFVDGVVGRAVPDALRGEFSQLLRGMVGQFALLKRHAPVDLHQITFDRIHWATDRQLVIRMMHRGKPLLPRDVGW